MAIPEDFVTPGARLEALAIAQLRQERGDRWSLWAPPLVLVVVQPSFKVPIAYEAVRQHRAARLLARRTVWRRDVDRARVPPSLSSAEPEAAALAPTFEVAEGPLDEEAFLREQQALAAASVPAFPPTGHMGLDGVTFELVLSADLVSTRYRWWTSPPPGWEPLATFVQRFIQLSERAIGVSHDPPRA
jgi:hypothetical protein